jgi:cytochrome o ubiquinol oxidase subunit 2
MDPHGPVGRAQKLILLDALAIMLVIAVPVIFATLAFAWWFRTSNGRARYRPDWTFSGHLELLVWSVPTLIVIFLAGIAWSGSHVLDPYKPLPGNTLEIEVVSLDWKWLFIYPEAGIATVNQLVVPVGTPLHFRLTSNGVINSFFVPQLGSQIYTMAGMVSQLNLQADDAGTYRGLSGQFSGKGFADMDFAVKAVSAADFAAWVAQAKTASALDAAAYAALAKPGTTGPLTYGSVLAKAFDDIVSPSAMQMSE